MLEEKISEGLRTLVEFTCCLCSSNVLPFNIVMGSKLSKRRILYCTVVVVVFYPW